MYLALVYTDCVHFFKIIACSEGLSMKTPNSQECHVVFQKNQIPSGYAKESLKGYNVKKEGSHQHYRSFHRHRGLVDSVFL